MNPPQHQEFATDVTSSFMSKFDKGQKKGSQEQKKSQKSPRTQEKPPIKSPKSKSRGHNRIFNESPSENQPPTSNHQSDRPLMKKLGTKYYAGQNFVAVNTDCISQQYVDEDRVPEPQTMSSVEAPSPPPTIG